jgi:hypothetical protein
MLQRAPFATVAAFLVSVATSRSVASDRARRANTSASTSPSCLHGAHCPHDSIARNRDAPATAATTSIDESITKKLPDPSPLPIADMSS